MNSNKLLFHIHKLYIIFLITSVGICKAQDVLGNNTARNEQVHATTISEEVGNYFSDMWLEGTDMVRILWKECSKKMFDKESKVPQDILPIAVQCVKRKTLKALDRTLSADIIPLAQGVELVRYQQINKNGKIIKPHAYNYHQSNSTGRTTSEDYENSDWKFAVIEKIIKVFNTHVLKVDVAQEDKTEIAEGRHRRRNQMMQMMMFGIMSMGMILVPMGFQFLAVLGGKALLLAKFALILSSIQALKKASAGSVNYSFPPVAAIPPEHTFEKRGYDTPITDSEIKTGIEEAQQFQALQNIENTGKIAYRFDHDNKVWKPQQNSFIKRFDVDVENPNQQNIYPVYSVPSTLLMNNKKSDMMNEMRPVYPGFQPMVDSMISENYKVQPTEIHAEYTIDLPIDKVQLKTTSPFITTATTQQ